MPFIDTPRGQFTYRQTGGTDPTLLFLHGNLGSSRWWLPTFDLLPAEWRAVAPDAIGYGESEHTDDLHRFAIPALLQDMSAFIQALDLPPLHLIAHSTATPVAIEYALAFPGLVASLTLVGPVPTAGIATPPEAYPLLEIMAEDKELRNQALRSTLPALPPDSPQFAQLLADTAKTSPAAYVGIARGLDAWRPGDRLRQLTLPVLLMRGKLDIMLGEQEAQQTLLSIPGAGNLEILQGVGHGPMIENPQGFVQPLIAFIDEDWTGYEDVRDSVQEEKTTNR
jgi:pimeloyl-ACP methyl ester carboxylesterase